VRCGSSLASKILRSSSRSCGTWGLAAPSAVELCRGLRRPQRGCSTKDSQIHYRLIGATEAAARAAGAPVKYTPSNHLGGGGRRGGAARRAQPLNTEDFTPLTPANTIQCRKHFAGSWFILPIRRANLDSSKVLIGASVEVRENFKFYKHLRNKHLIHDENSNSQVSVVAVLNDGSKPYKIEGVRTMTMRFDDFGAQALVNFKSVVNWTFDFVRREFGPLLETIRIELESKPPNELQKLPAPEHKVPSVADILKPRPKK
jgi:hypothetical protein